MAKFQPGKSGNPGGRPKIPDDVKGWARSVFAKDGRAAVEQEIASRGPNWFRAVELVMAYAYGKPTQPISGDDAAPPLEIVIKRASV